MIYKAVYSVTGWVESHQMLAKMGGRRAINSKAFEAMPSAMASCIYGASVAL